jgi:hypothetical protein
MRKMRFTVLVVLALAMAASHTSDACPTPGPSGPPPPPPPQPSCPAGKKLYTGKWTCHCGYNNGKRETPTCPSGFWLKDFWCTCERNRLMEIEQGKISCGSVIQDLTFKNSIGCINCATEFCLEKKNSSLLEVIKDELKCKATLECLAVHGKKCGCIA